MNEYNGDYKITTGTIDANQVEDRSELKVNWCYDCLEDFKWDDIVVYINNVYDSGYYHMKCIEVKGHRIAAFIKGEYVGEVENVGMACLEFDVEKSPNNSSEGSVD